MPPLVVADPGEGHGGPRPLPPPLFLNQTVCIQGQNFNNFENDGMNLSVSKAKLTGYVCVVGNVLLFNSRFRFSNLPSDPKSYHAFRGVNEPQEPVFGPEGKFFKLKPVKHDRVSNLNIKISLQSMK